MNNTLGNIEEAEVIWEETTPLSGAGGDRPLLRWVARKADQLTAGNRGGWVTEALILAGYASDPTRLREAYHKGKPNIEEYFDQVNVQKMISDAGPGTRATLKAGLVELIQHNVPGFLAGSILAATSIIAINKYKQR